VENNKVLINQYIKQRSMETIFEIRDPEINCEELRQTIRDNIRWKKMAGLLPPHPDSLPYIPPDGLNLSINIKLIPKIDDMVAGREYSLKIWIKNNGNQKISSNPPHPVHISYHWREEKGSMVIFEGNRLPFIPSLEPQHGRLVDLPVMPPLVAGNYILEITLVQEGGFWFENVVVDLPYLVACTINQNNE
jgi:hypothetical protein